MRTFRPKNIMQASKSKANLFLRTSKAPSEWSQEHQHERFETPVSEGRFNTDFVST